MTKLEEGGGNRSVREEVERKAGDVFGISRHCESRSQGDGTIGGGNVFTKKHGST